MRLAELNIKTNGICLFVVNYGAMAFSSLHFQFFNCQVSGGFDCAQHVFHFSYSEKKKKKIPKIKIIISIFERSAQINKSDACRGWKLEKHTGWPAQWSGSVWLGVCF